jgi:preprotein translocase subunit YajC
MILYGIWPLLADAVPATRENPTGATVRLVLTMGIFLVIMWVLMIGPQRKKAKEQDLMLKALRPGDKIVTASGIVAVVLSIKDKSLSVRSADTKLEILKSAVAEVTERSGEPAEAKN